MFWEIAFHIMTGHDIIIAQSRKVLWVVFYAATTAWGMFCAEQCNPIHAYRLILSLGAYSDSMRLVLEVCGLDIFLSETFQKLVDSYKMYKSLR